MPARSQHLRRASPQIPARLRHDVPVRWRRREQRNEATNANHLPEVDRAISSAALLAQRGWVRGWVCTDHVLVALASERGSAAAFFQEHGVDNATLVRALDNRTCPDQGSADAEPPQLTTQAQAVTIVARVLASGGPTSERDLFRGTISEPDGCAHRLLRNVGIDPDGAWNDFVKSVVFRGSYFVDRRWLKTPPCDRQHVRRVDGIRARAPDASDEEGFQAGVDADTIRWQGWTPTIAEKTRAVATRLKEITTLCGAFGWCPTVLSAVTMSGTYVGAYMFDDIDLGGSTASLGWFHTPSERGKGHGRAALSAALSYGHGHLGVTEIRMGTAEDNVRVRRQIESTGALFSHRDESVLRNGQQVSAVWFVHRVGTESEDAAG